MYNKIFVVVKYSDFVCKLTSELYSARPIKPKFGTPQYAKMCTSNYWFVLKTTIFHWIVNETLQVYVYLYSPLFLI